MSEKSLTKESFIKLIKEAQSLCQQGSFINWNYGKPFYEICQELNLDPEETKKEIEGSAQTNTI